MQASTARRLSSATVQSALDFAVSVQYETQCERICINKEAFAADFFVLSTRLAGEVLQKYINYHIKLAVYGDFSMYTSKPLKDFIYECNNGKDFFFAADEAGAADKLCG
jgi:hypothetical protein